MDTPMLRRLREGSIGAGAVLDGPYGTRRVTYADQTASGQALDFVEDYIRRTVLNGYANTHTEASSTGAQTGALREQARAVIHRAVGGGPDDVVLFCGSGSTMAVNKLVALLGLRIPESLDERYALSDRIPAAARPVVFVGPYEHHSNVLPWRESIADVVEIGSDERGHPDLDDLRKALDAYGKRPLRIGSFSAASNVTGLITDVEAISALLREHGALSVWDYAAGGPYLPISMAGKDAIFLSPHKFPGGPQTPGVLVVGKHLIVNPVPTAPGGGTVAFVDPDSHRYLDDPVAREEGGTPAIVESIRAGLVFGVKEAVGADVITAREHRMWERARERWAGEPRIEILGDLTSPRLPIVSFQIRAGEHYLHHNYVVALLNDLFGIQARGGCSCAGPYGHRLLGIGPELSRRFENEIDAGWEGIKPGWSRLNFAYFLSDQVADYLSSAVSLIASHGARLLTDYRFDPRTGQWRHVGFHAVRPSLSDLQLHADGTVTMPDCPAPIGEDALPGYLSAARALMESRPEPADGGAQLPAAFEKLRWFLLPAECLSEYRGAPLL
ncbi:aminotransferase class V-fold PLP-dependent enzyme [Actinoplanes sp. LDG1-06]|uniref:Aminotransferase class V-fold PLP-dependent enzyme n=1 Tax=Paractinoplanes ovalisporus TaxID=2810368 RepID=A0ABS2A447_9ACTN|nr:aminotransferase class V-fold PLP-dependent enzyme [Actinoplanes ovalisporus]MBM2614617.1 aminotransferase class V-fold PLP-dependent enzyme [Actinoplanes ovalisporus]